MALLTIPEAAVELIKQGEGFRSSVYRCTTGHLTIGYGTKLPLGAAERKALGLGPKDPIPDGVTEFQAHALLKLRLLQDWTRLQPRAIARFGVNFGDIPPGKCAVLADMVYNLGVSGLLGFRLMWAAIANYNWILAAAEAKDSKWYHQVGSRGKRNVELLLKA